MPNRRQINRNTQIVSKNRQSGIPWFKRVRNIIIIAVLAIVVAVGGWSIYYFESRPYKQTAIQVKDVKLDMQYFINMCKLYYGKAPSDTAIAQFADWVEQQIEQGQKIINGSKALGVEIPRSDIEKELKKAGIAISRESVDIWMAQDLVTKQVPPSQPQYNVQTMLLESEATAQTAIARLQAGEAFSQVTGDLSKYPPGTIDTANMGWVTPREADITLKSSKFGSIISNAGAGVVGGPAYDDTVIKRFGYWVAEIVEMTYAADNVTPSAIHLQGILLATEQEAKNIADQLSAGADINELAKQSSLINGAIDNGADLGWISESQDPNLFALTSRPLNTLVGPISDNYTETMGGYWVFNILEKNENMALTSDQQSKLENDFLERCAAELAKDPKYEVKNLLTQDMKDLALNQVVLAQGKGSILIGTDSLPAGEQGIKYSYKLLAYGEQNGNTWSITSGSLPEGLSLDKSTGEISGIPRFGGGGGFTLRVGNAIHFHEQEFSYQIRVAVLLVTKSLPDATVGTDYFEVLEVVSDVETNSWSIIKGNLPDGLSLDQNTGAISGTPTVTGAFSFTVQVDDGIAKSAQDLTINVQ